MFIITQPIGCNIFIQYDLTLKTYALDLSILLSVGNNKNSYIFSSSERKI